MTIEALVLMPGHLTARRGASLVTKSPHEALWVLFLQSAVDPNMAILIPVVPRATIAIHFEIAFVVVAGLRRNLGYIGVFVAVLALRTSRYHLSGFGGFLLFGLGRHVSVRR
jgi:hypothetical protein